MKLHTTFERLDDGHVRVVEVSLCRDDCPDWEEGQMFTRSEPLAVTGMKPLAVELAEAFSEGQTDV